MCGVQVVSRVPLTLAPQGSPIHLTHARGYLYLATQTGVAVFNTTGFSNRRGPKMILAHLYAEIASAFAPDPMVSPLSCYVQMVSLALYPVL